MRIAARVIAVAAATLLSGCVTPPRDVVEYLDEETAASITAVQAPLVFARPQPHASANSRDYATMVAASVNRSGKYEYLLLVYVWSTLDPRTEDNINVDDDKLLLFADDREIKLEKDQRSSQEAGIARPLYVPAGTRSPPRVYPTDLDTLRFISRAQRMRMQLGDNNIELFEIWSDAGRADLERFTRIASE